MSQQTRRAAHRRPRAVARRGGGALSGAGLAVALWFGMTAPSVSPVASPAPVAHSVAQTVLSGR